jgi:FAD/FMN-containing dehydrogenase
VLPFGMGRSYGDSCLNSRGILIDMKPLNRFMSFDREVGVLRCEAGVTLEEILRVVVPRGWFLAVTPGTKHVTVGGAIANDVHGKNHHRAGTFGCHVSAFELLRSDARRVLCSPTENTELFRATIGGLGLTGVIVWAELRLRRVTGPFIDQDTVAFGSLDEFFGLSEDSDAKFEHTVAWIDCFARGTQLGRGILFRGNHADAPSLPRAAMPRMVRATVRANAPRWLLSNLTLRALGSAYYRFMMAGSRTRRVHYDPFFYPLDAVGGWNRLYGVRGFLQWQCVVPPEDGPAAIHAVFNRVARAGGASFLSVLKRFGRVQSPGLLSFPRPGLTLALDFPFEGTPTLKLLSELDAIVRDAGGAIYPAKDARMSPQTFSAGFPQLDRFLTSVDPRFSSNLWQRLMTANAEENT